MLKKNLSSHFLENEFGGTLLKQSHAKTHRPMSLSKTMHFVFRSNLAKGSRSFMRPENRRIILQVLKRHKKLVRLQNMQIESGQIQIFLKVKTRSSALNFLRIFTGLVARRLTQSEKAQPKLRKKRFWSFRPYSRSLPTPSRPWTEMAMKYYLQSIAVLRVPGMNSS